MWTIGFIFGFFGICHPCFPFDFFLNLLYGLSRLFLLHRTHAQVTPFTSPHICPLPPSFTHSLLSPVLLLLYHAPHHAALLSPHSCFFSPS